MPHKTPNARLFLMVEIRPEQPDDIAGIRVVHETSFPTAGEARLVDALRTAGRLSVSLVAVMGNEIVGHVAFSTVQATGSASGVGLAPVAVLPPHRRRGIAERLIRDGLVMCRERSFSWVVVLGEPHYYARFGFAPATRWGLTDEYGGGDAFQALELLPGAIPQGAGIVRYAPEFEAL